MKQEKINDFLKTLSYGMTYQVLEEASDADEIAAVGKKHNLVLPAKDLSLFKCIYGFVDQENLNGCTLPKDEVVKAMATLRGKSIDFDHLRKKIVGYWLEGNLIEDTIMAYGVFFKGSLVEEYKEIKDLFNAGKLKISMEAWGTKTSDDESYELTDIEFAGGALLINTDPAFPGAKVLELANVKEPKSFVKFHEVKVMNKKEQYLERAKFFVSDMDYVMRSMSAVECPHCDEKYSLDVESIDFANGKAEAMCYLCEGKSSITFMPKVKKMEKATEDAFKITNVSKINNTKLEDSKKMDEKLKELEAKVIELSAKIEAKDAELVAATAQLTEVSKNLEEATATITSFSAEKDAAIKLAAENATKVAERKAELAEFSKDLKDEDLLDDKSYEIAKLKKANAELEAKIKAVPVTASVQTDNQTLEVGTKDKKESEITAKQKRVDEFAFGKQS
jgi:hypothetical protein